jgi:hypothetical protein
VESVQAWAEGLRHEPIKPLLGCAYPAIRYFARRDLLGEEVEPVQTLWGLPEPKKLLRHQREDGAWPVPPKYPEKYPDMNYPLIETFRRLRELVGKYELDRSHPQIEAAAELILSCQTPEGDIRGFYVDQYAPHYTGLLVELLTRAGYGDDPRIDKAIRWLIEVRQDDGGWTSPLLTSGISWAEEVHISSHHSPTLPFKRDSPASHNLTGIALRGLACSPRYAHSPEAKRAGELLASRFFQKDAYTSYEAADNWVRFLYPWWWNNLPMALDSLALIGFTGEHPKVREGLRWLAENQSSDGLWENSYKKGAKRYETESAAEGRLWVSLAICRIMKAYGN